MNLQSVVARVTSATMSRISRNKQDLKSKRDEKLKQNDTSKTDERNEPAILSNYNDKLTLNVFNVFIF